MTGHVHLPPGFYPCPSPPVSRGTCRPHTVTEALRTGPASTVIPGVRPQSTAASSPTAAATLVTARGLHSSHSLRLSPWPAATCPAASAPPQSPAVNTPSRGVTQPGTPLGLHPTRGPPCEAVVPRGASPPEHRLRAGRPPPEPRRTGRGHCSPRTAAPVRVRGPILHRSGDTAGGGLPAEGSQAWQVGRSVAPTPAPRAPLCIYFPPCPSNSVGSRIQDRAHASVCWNPGVPWDASVHTQTLGTP